MDNSKQSRLGFTIGLATLACLVGCVSPLKSDDPAIRLQAVAQIASQDDLFFIAMNVGFDVGSRRGSFYNSVLYAESYADDVRVAATKRLSDPVCLLRCAAWADGDVLRLADDSTSSSYTYNGTSYSFLGRSPQAPACPGDCVRRVATERICEPRIFAMLPNALGSVRQIADDRMAVLDRVLAQAVRTQKDQAAIATFLVSFANAADVLPKTLQAAVSALDGSNASAVERSFDALFGAESSSKRKIPALCGWQLLAKMAKPSAERQLVLAKLGYGDEASEAVRKQIDALAESVLSEDTWARCYRERLFTGYPRSKMLSNIKDAQSKTRLLIDLRKIDVNDLDAAFAGITDAPTLERIRRDCYLKVVSEKAELLHFALTYRKRFADLGKMTAKVERALAAREFRTLMDKSDIEQNEKDALAVQLKAWIAVGADQIVADAEAYAETSFIVAGFRPGMKEAEARLLFECRYPEEAVSWTSDKNGQVERIDFGTTFLAKVFRFDVQTWKDWIAAFAQKTGRMFAADTLRDERKPIGGGGTTVKVSQQIWRYQDSRRDLTATYFGDKEVREVEPERVGFIGNVLKLARGVTGGDVVKEVVLEGARHWANKEWDSKVGGVPGSLRVERGTVGPGGTRKVSRPTGKSALDRTADSVKDTWNAVKDIMN